MSDTLVNRIRRENYILEIFEMTKDSWYTNKAKLIIGFVQTIYRSIEPSHFEGDIVVFAYGKAGNLISETSNDFYDSGILSHNFKNIVFQINDSDEILPFIWMNLNSEIVNTLVSTDSNFIAYKYSGIDKKEYFIVNGKEVYIINTFSCPSIFALQYHYLEEAILDYKIERIKSVSCEHFKTCFADDNYIYFKNKPEDCMQKSLAEFLKSRIRGINITREYNLGASKPVDVRIYWNEANRAALIELKWLGQSLNNDGTIGTPYSNSRVNDGMSQIKEYIDLCNQDTPTVINKGYLVVIDGRRAKITPKVRTISREDGFKYAGDELIVREEFQFWKSFPNINPVIRMFTEPICTI